MLCCIHGSLSLFLLSPITWYKLHIIALFEGASLTCSPHWLKINLEWLIRGRNSVSCSILTALKAVLLLSLLLSFSGTDHWRVILVGFSTLSPTFDLFRAIIATTITSICATHELLAPHRGYIAYRSTSIISSTCSTTLVLVRRFIAHFSMPLILIIILKAGVKPLKGLISALCSTIASINIFRSAHLLLILVMLVWVIVLLLLLITVGIFTKWWRGRRASPTCIMSNVLLILLVASDLLLWARLIYYHAIPCSCCIRVIRLVFLLFVIIIRVNMCYLWSMFRWTYHVVHGSWLLIMLFVCIGMVLLLIRQVLMISRTGGEGAQNDIFATNDADSPLLCCGLCRWFRRLLDVGLIDDSGT